MEELYDILRKEREVFIIAGNLGTLIMINKDFSPRDPTLWDTMIFSTPRVSAMVEGREVIKLARRTDVNMTLDMTLGDEETCVSFLCEDQAVDFSVVKIDAELRKGESFGFMFGTNLEVVSKGVITSTLHV